MKLNIHVTFSFYPTHCVYEKFENSDIAFKNILNEGINSGRKID